MGTEHMSGGQAVVAALQKHGVRTVFGIPGGHCLPIYDALARQQQVRHVLGRHEQGLGFMADGYARASGRLGVAIVTSGPAVANLAGALGGATTDTSPVLVIASTVPSDLVGKNRGGLHDCGEALEIVRPVCRHVRRCTTVGEIPHVIAELIHRLRTGRPGAAFCEIPCDVLAAEAEMEVADPLPVVRLAPDPRAVAQAAELLGASERPLIIAGKGATISEAGGEVGELARRLGALVLPTTLGRGILPGDDLRVITHDGATVTKVYEVVAEADVVLAVGTMFRQEDTAEWALRPGERLIHIDIDPEEISRSYRPEVGIVADAKAALDALLEALPERAPARKSWLARGKTAEKQRLQRRREQGPLEMAVLNVFRAALPRDGIAVCDRCSLGYWAFRCMSAYAPRTFQFPLGYGGLGGALPQAVGAKLARPERTVVCVIGDGGFQFTGTELAVAVQESTPITIVLCNNSAYGAIRAGQDRNYGGRRFGVELRNPDFQKLAAAYGIPAVRVGEVDSFRAALAKGIGSAELNLIELTAELMDPPSVTLTGDDT
ncbi:MAG: thiamine pyrophosphate-binding protein [Candidatus Brocadiia bacterium]|nr:thiamine pyrophosphate-binding protein [Candidatus Brocadiia bacterium]